jgi:peptide methionine sulfoxide reductase msrA/msrB
MEKKISYETAIFAGGCFWGVEHLLKDLPGVADIVPGYTGGTVENPTYEQVRAHTTGHAEAVRILFDPQKTTYETLVKAFMEIHDPTQADGQGPDIGPQYRSEIFYTTPAQKQTASAVIGLLKQKGLSVVTRVTPAGPFWTAEEYHHKYYARKGTEPYCHRRVKRF